MTPGRLLYEVYIKATPEQVWRAITDPAFTRRYFHHLGVESTFQVGTPVRYVQPDGTDAIVGSVEECEPPHRLVTTWSFRSAPEVAAEAPSRVRWTVTAVGEGLTRLDLEHGDLAKSPHTWARVEHGWNWVLDSLKSFVETGAPLPPISDGAEPAPADDAEAEWHRAMGIAANNLTWTWLGQPAGERTADDDEAMTRSAYAAAHHWARAARRTAANDARAEWLLARVWVARGNGSLALHHADRCAAITTVAGLVDFDLAYAHEARARALACLGQRSEAEAERAAATAVAIADPEDRAIVEQDLAAGPWFGLATIDV